MNCYYITLTLLSILISLPSSEAASIKLVTGDEINAEIFEETDSYIKADHRVLGKLMISRNQILTIEKNIQINADSAIKDEKKDNGLLGTRLLTNWQRSLTIGLNGQEGNSDALDFHVAFDANYKNDKKRWDIGTDYNFSEEDGESTQDDLNVHFTRDWLLPDSEWLYFTSGKFERDKFESWDYRLSGVGGIGYEFIDKESFLLVGRTGIAGTKKYGSDENDFKPEMMLGLNSDWEISKVQSISFSTVFFAPFDQFDDYRNHSKLDWKFKLDTEMDLSFKLGLENEYESIVDDGIKNNDFKYRAALIWGL